MTKPLSDYFDALDAYPDGEVPEADFQELRRALAAKYLEASGRTQQQFGASIGRSTTIVQRIIGTAMRWQNCERIADALGLPEACLRDAESALEFFEGGQLFINILDAVTHYASVPLKASRLMPLSYVADLIEGSALADAERDALAAYLNDPTSEEAEEALTEPMLANLEALLGLPPRAIRNPQAVADTRTRSNRIANRTRRNVAINVTRLMHEERLSVETLAEMSGRSVVEIKALLAPPHKLSLNLFYGLAAALSVEPPTRLMSDNVDVNDDFADLNSDLVADRLCKDAPKVVHRFISEFLAVVRERQPGDTTQPTGAAEALLVLTPVLHSVVKLLKQHSGMLQSGQMPDLPTLFSILAKGFANQRGTGD